MNVRLRTIALSGLLAAAGAGAVPAQQPAQQPVQAPAVGEMAPDFEIRGATRFGVLKDRLRLSDLRDQTVVLAFFARARTRG
ncbi:MAG: hypothetical protein WD801_13020 [Gemmatimonadaceae bacterium]